MTTKEFIEKAIQGGWNSKSRTAEFIAAYDEEKIVFVFLDPLAWQAVGKVEGWGIYTTASCMHCGIVRETGIDKEKVELWKLNIHRMIDALIEGKTIEQYLKTL